MPVVIAFVENGVFLCYYMGDKSASEANEMSICSTNEKKSEKTPFVSIIMPVYRVEKFLEAAVNSVLEQTFDDYELLLVDDCSPDKSGVLCDELAGRDSRIKVIHLNPNGGVSRARNTAMEKAIGEYILFLDSDDVFDNDLVERVVAVTRNDSVTENVPADVVVFGMLEEHYNKNGELINKVEVLPERKSLKTAQQVREYVLELEKINLYGNPTKLYRAETLKKSGALFPIMKFNEDIIFNIDFFNSVERCEVLNFMPYHYIKRFESSTTSRFIATYYEDIMVKIDKLYKQFEAWEMLTPEVLDLIAQRYVRYVFSALQRNCDKRSKMNRKQRKQFLDKVFESRLYSLLRPNMSGSGLAGIMAAKLKNKQSFSCRLIARIIYFIKKFMPKLFGRVS